MTTSSSTALNRNWRRVDGIDLLRALAIFFVLMNHVNMRLLGAHVHYLKLMPSQLAASLVWNGQYGVQIFFAISGFLITSTSLRRWNPISTISIGDFYKMRFARIAPLLLSLLAMLTILHFARVDHFVVSSDTGGLGRALLAAITFHVNLLEAHRGYLPPSWDIMWSLSIEETFYFFFPLICRALGRGKMLMLLLFALVALGPFGRTVFAHGNPVWSEYSYLGGMDAIAMGCLTAFFSMWRPLSKWLLVIAGILGASLLIFVLGFSLTTYRLGLGHTGLTMSLVGVGTCLLILVSVQSRWSSPAVLLPVLKLGQRSYEIYLTHVFVLLFLFDLYLRTGKSMHFIPILFLGVIVVAGLVGEAVSRYFTEPLNRKLRAHWNDDATHLGESVKASTTQNNASS